MKLWCLGKKQQLKLPIHRFSHYHFAVKFRRSATKAILIALVLILVPVSALSAQKVTPGSTCKVLNQKTVYSNKTYTCIKSGKKLVWNKGVLVVKPTPMPTPTAIGDPIGAVGGTPTIAPTPTPTPEVKPAETIVFQPGQNCSKTDNKTVKISDGILYCVQVSDGSYKFIEHYSIAPVISNPQSPEPLEACEAPDLRGPIPSQMSFLAIAHNSVVPSSPLLKHSGTLNLLVVPIDFQDAAGTSEPESVYRKDFDTMSKWFAVNSNNKLQVVIDFKNKWFRVPLPAAKYDPSLMPVNNYESQKNLVQDYINLTSSQVDYSKADTVVFVYPKSASTSGGYLSMWNANFNIGQSSKSFSVLSSIGTAGKYEPFWEWLSHEMLHSMGLAMHFPANPAGWGVEWGRYTYSEALLPWNQMILDWINPDQYYCVSANNIVKTNVTLVPQESELAGLRTIFIRVSTSEVLMVVSFRKDVWGYQIPDDFYGTMVALIDTSKQLDWSGEHIDDKFDGVKYQRPGLWLHPVNQVQDDNSWTNEHTGEGGALMYLGDEITYKGITIKLVKSNNFDTVEISRS